MKMLRQSLLFVHCQPPAPSGELHWEVKLLDAAWVQAVVFFVPVAMDSFVITHLVLIKSNIQCQLY